MVTRSLTSLRYSTLANVVASPRCWLALMCVNCYPFCYATIVVSRFLTSSETVFLTNYNGFTIGLAMIMTNR